MRVAIELSRNGIFVALNNLIEIIWLAVWWAPRFCAVAIWRRILTWSWNASPLLGGIWAMIHARWPASSAACSCCTANAMTPFGSGLRRMRMKRWMINQSDAILTGGSHCRTAKSWDDGDDGIYKKINLVYVYVKLTCLCTSKLYSER